MVLGLTINSSSSTKEQGNNSCYLFLLNKCHETILWQIISLHNEIGCAINQSAHNKERKISIPYARLKAVSADVITLKVKVVPFHFFMYKLRLNIPQNSSSI